MNDGLPHIQNFHPGLGENIWVNLGRQPGPVLTGDIDENDVLHRFQFRGEAAHYPTIDASGDSHPS